MPKTKIEAPALKSNDPVDAIVKNISATADDFKELATNIICNAFRSEAESFVAEFLDTYGLVLTKDDEEALTEHVCGFFSSFGGKGSAHDVLWSYLRRRLDERFPLTSLEFGHE